MFAMRWRIHWRATKTGSFTWSFTSHISKGVEWWWRMR